MENLSPVTIDGKKYSGINSGLGSKVFRAVDISALQNEPGWIYDADGRVESWKLETVSESDGAMMFYGPRVEGAPFDDGTFDREILEKIIRTFQAIRDKNGDYRGFYSRSWFFLEDGRVLVLPVSLMEFIRKSENEKNRLTNWYPYNHPDKTDVSGMEFTAAVLAARLLSGKHPYAPLEEAEDNRNEQLRRPPLLEAGLQIPGIKTEIASLIDRSLKNEDCNLKEWTALLADWKTGGACRELNSAEKDEIDRKAAQFLEKGEKNRKRRQVWRRKSSLYIAVAAAFLFLGIMISGPVRKAMAPPVTMGLSPREVVEAYYSSFNTMDQELMEDCIDKDLGKREVGEITNLFVTSRVRMGYEGNSGFIRADEWVAAGKEPLEFGSSVYGVTDLEIHELGSGRFRAEYEKWMPGAPDDRDPSDTSPIPPYGTRVTDHLTLEEQNKGNWLIVERERTIVEIPYP
ncbi:MAG: hypothetical protein PQJ58_04355 [Spirochaetales bacterium]|nr:hypothetical protein [Spirochaetales bacterium]